MIIIVHRSNFFGVAVKSMCVPHSRTCCPFVPAACPPEQWNVGKYFDYEGNFDEWGMGDAVKKLVTRLEKRARDKKKKEKKEK